LGYIATGTLANNYETKREKRRGCRKLRCGVSWIFIRYFTGRKRVDNEKKKREIRNCGEWAHSPDGRDGSCFPFRVHRQKPWKESDRVD